MIVTWFAKVSNPQPKAPAVDSEDKLHIIQCPALSTRQQWKSSLDKLNWWVQKQGQSHNSPTLSCQTWTSVHRDTLQTNNNSTASGRNNKELAGIEY